MRTTYTPFERWMKRLVRSFWPIPGSPLYTPEDDICSVELIPQDRFTEVMRQSIRATEAAAGPGAYVEFGVFNGTSLACAADAARAEGASSLRLIGIDSFQGLPGHVAGEDGGVWKPGQFACSQADTYRCLAARDLDPNTITLLSRWYDDLSPEELGDLLSGDRIKILMVDCDAYSSARQALALAMPHLASKAVIFFDDWRLRDVDLLNGGEYRAFNECRARNPGIRVERFQSYSRKSEAFFITSNQSTESRK